MSSLRKRVNGGVVRAFLVVDLVAMLVFLVLGEYTHGINPLFNLGRFVGTAVPFLVGWFLAAPLAGAYSLRAMRSFKYLVAVTVGAWLVADVIAQLIRGTDLFPGNAVLSFFLVAASLGALFLVGGRVTVVALLSRHAGPRAARST